MRFYNFLVKSVVFGLFCFSLSNCGVELNQKDKKIEPTGESETEDDDLKLSEEAKKKAEAEAKKKADAEAKKKADAEAKKKTNAKKTPEPEIETPENKPEPETPELPFSLNPEQMAQSNFCGSLRPDLPENPTPAHRFDIELLDEKLASDTGLRGWMHGVVKQYNHYIFTYRSEDRSDPMAFFKAEQFSLVPTTNAVKEQLDSLGRHDGVSLYGHVGGRSAPFRHIIVTRVEVTTIYDKKTENNYEVDLSKLANLDHFQLFGKVHAMIEVDHGPRAGHAIVVEHKDMMFPIITHPSHSQIAKTLFRNDIVNIHLEMRSSPNRPPHFYTDRNNPDAIQIVDEVANCHGVETTLEGYLVKFHKSPAISTDVYAVRVVDANGIGRNFTFFPDATGEDFVRLFYALKEKSESAWDAGSQTPEVVRNYWKKTNIQVRVSGRMNVVSTEQANPQIYVKDVANLTFTEL